MSDRPSSSCQTTLITEDSPANLHKRLFGCTPVFYLKELQPGWVKLVKELGFPRDVQAVKNQLVDQLDDPEGQNPAIIRSLVEAGAEIQYVGEMHHSLEDNYL